MLNLDTHIVLYMFSGKLIPAEAKLLSDVRLGISSIVLWEIARLRELGKISIGLENPELRRLIV